MLSQFGVYKLKSFSFLALEFSPIQLLVRLKAVSQLYFYFLPQTVQVAIAPLAQTYIHTGQGCSFITFTLPASRLATSARYIRFA